MEIKAAPDADQTFKALVHTSGRSPRGRQIYLIKPDRSCASDEAAAIALRELTDDLLHGILQPGPVLRAYARRISRAPRALSRHLASAPAPGCPCPGVSAAAFEWLLAAHDELGRSKSTDSRFRTTPVLVLVRIAGESRRVHGRADRDAA